VSDQSGDETTQLTLHVQQEQVRLALVQLKQIPALHLLVDMGCAIIVIHYGASHLVWLWVLAMVAVVRLRTNWLMRLSQRADWSPKKLLMTMAITMALQGLLHSMIILVAAQIPDSTALYAISLVMMGVAAGAVTPAAGYLPIYGIWALFFGTVLGGTWLSRGTTEGLVFAGLLTALIFLFGTYVKDQGVTIKKLVQMADRLRQARDRAEAAQQIAEKASRARTRFFAAANHDLRQPLHALSLNVATIQAVAEHSDDAILKSVGEVMGRSLVDSNGLLKSLLDISELDAGAIKTNLRPVAVSRLLRDMCDSFQDTARSQNLLLHADLPAGDATDAAWVMADETQLKRMLGNLISNAIKFTQQGSVVLSASLDRGASMWRLTVTDTGHGIPPEEQENVFEEFYQVGNPERDRTKGLGLGLAIVRRLGELMGAQLRLVDSSGSGSTFEISLPAASPGSDIAMDLPEQSSPEHLRALTGRGYRVLIVDDEQTIRHSLTHFLQVMGWEPQAVASGQDAMALLEAGWRPDATVVDYRLANQGSGIDVWQALKSRYGDVPTVLVTGDTSPDRIAQAKQSGLPLLYKPVDGAALVALLDELIQAQT